jgi:hypothetical protein
VGGTGEMEATTSVRPINSFGLPSNLSGNIIGNVLRIFL